MPLLIIFLILIAIIFCFVFITPTAIKNTLEKNLRIYLNDHLGTDSYHLNNATNKLYDYDLTIKGIHYLIKVVHLPSYAEVQINNKVTWEVKYGAGNVPGKPQPNRKYLDGIRPFLNHQPSEDSKKVVILTPKAKKIVKYINECEIIFVNAHTDVYGTTVINEDDYKLFIE